jgi:hypothetical protein
MVAPSALLKWMNRKMWRKEAGEDEDTNMIMALLAKRGRPGLIPADLEKLNPPDEYDTGLKTMATVRAYFQVAYKVCCYRISSWKSHYHSLRPQIHLARHRCVFLK